MTLEKKLMEVVEQTLEAFRGNKLDEAFKRIRDIAAPLNAKRIREEREWELLPGVEAGRCMDCGAENRICNIITIIEKKPRAIDISLLIIGEELGL